MIDLKLTQEQIDELAIYLEDQEIKKKVIFDILADLPDSQYGQGNIPDNLSGYCALCEEKLTTPEDSGTKYGKFVHRSCVEEEKAR